jgi:hypothetical protein
VDEEFVTVAVPVAVVVVAVDSDDAVKMAVVARGSGDGVRGRGAERETAAAGDAGRDMCSADVAAATGSVAAVPVSLSLRCGETFWLECALLVPKAAKRRLKRSSAAWPCAKYSDIS